MNHVGRRAPGRQQQTGIAQPEQQAGAIEDYNIAFRKSKDGSATLADYQQLATLELYMQKARNGEGAPGEDTESSDTETSPTDAGTPQDAGLPGGT